MSYCRLQKSKGRASGTTVEVFKKNVDQLLVRGALHAGEKIQKNRLLSEAPRNNTSSFVLIRDVRTRLLRVRGFYVLAGLFSSDFFSERRGMQEERGEKNRRTDAASTNNYFEPEEFYTRRECSSVYF